MAGFFGGEEADKNFVGRIIPENPRCGKLPQLSERKFEASAGKMKLHQVKRKAQQGVSIWSRNGQFRRFSRQTCPERLEREINRFS